MARAPLVLSLFAALVLAPSARAGGVEFIAPALAWQQKPVTVSLAVRPSGTRCTLSVRYANGAAQRGLATRVAAYGRVRWTWTVPLSAAPGRARMTATCRGVGRATRTITIVGVREMSFAAVPQQAWQQKPVTVSVAVRPSGTRCTLAVRYADGSTQADLATKTAAFGRVHWTWTVPVTADAGPARLTASCRGVGKLTRTMVVVGATAVRAVVKVRESGWTQRNDRSGTGSSVSYGIMVENPDLFYDAVGITLLINFVNAEGRIVGSKTDRVGGVAAGSEHGLGGSMRLLTQQPVTRLEIVVVDSDRAARALHFPSVTAVGVEPSRSDPGFLNAVHGEIVNDHPNLTLTRAKLSVVVRNADGAIVGGSTAHTSVALPPGARVLWKAQTGLTPIPLDRAASQQVSIEPTWTAP